MAKNMTRKGLAIGASAALAAAGVVGISSPAMADSNIYLVPAVGGAEQNRVPIEEDFTLSTYYGVNANGLVAPVSVQVVDADENLSAVTLSAPSGTAGNKTDPTYDSDDAIWSGGELKNTSAGIGNNETITLTPKGVTSDSETFSVVVTTWFDDGDGVVESGETQASQEVFFHVDDDYDWVIDFTKPELGDTALEATVSTTVPSINLAMFADNWGLGFAALDSADNDLTPATDDTVDSNTTDRITGGTAASDSSTEYTKDDSDDKDFVDFQSDGTVDFKLQVEDGNNKIVAGTYIAGVVFDGTNSNTSNPFVATKTDKLTDATEVQRAAALVETASVVEVTDPKLANSADTNPDNGNVRVGTNSVTVEADLYSDLGDDSSVGGTGANADTTVDAGVVATVTIAEGSTFDADSTLTAGGETLTDTTTDGEITFDVTTNADGEIAFAIDTSGLVKDDKFDISIVSQDVSSGTAQEFIVVETEAANLVEHNLLGAGAEWKVEDGTYTLLFAATDNFGEPLVGSDYQVVLSNGNSPAGEGDVQVSGLVNGVATFTVSTKNSDDADVSAFTATLRELDGINYTNVKVGTSNIDLQDTVSVNLGSSNVATTVSVKDGSDEAVSATDFLLPSDGSSDYNLALEDFADANERLGESNDVIDESVSEGVTLTGQIADAAGIATHGDVTISADGLLFRAIGPTSTDSSAGSLDVYSMDSITVQTDTLGNYSVDVFSNTAGKVDVTVSSGNASKTAVLHFADAADNTGTELTIDAPSAVAPGATLQYTATLVDEYGNPVDGGSATTSALKVNYDGPGFVVGTLPEEFGADGSITVSVFLGNNDGGKTGTLTVSYTPENGKDAATYEFDGDDDLVVQKTVNIGNVPSSSTGGEFNAWTKLIENDTAVKFYAKNPSNQGKIQFFFNGEEIAWHRGTSATSYEGGEPRYNEDQDAYYLVRDVELVSGIKNVFEIEQDGERIWRAVKTLD